MAAVVERAEADLGVDQVYECLGTVAVRPIVSQAGKLPAANSLPSEIQNNFPDLALTGMSSSPREKDWLAR